MQAQDLGLMLNPGSSGAGAAAAAAGRELAAGASPAGAGAVRRGLAVPAPVLVGPPAGRVAVRCESCQARCGTASPPGLRTAAFLDARATPCLLWPTRPQADVARV